MSDLSLAASIGHVIFVPRLFVSSRRHISEPTDPVFGRPLQLLKGEVDLFRGLALYVRDSFSVYRQRSYERECY